jgi:hypothetical protein
LRVLFTMRSYFLFRVEHGSSTTPILYIVRPYLVRISFSLYIYYWNQLLCRVPKILGVDEGFVKYVLGKESSVNYRSTTALLCSIHNTTSERT